LVRFRRLNLLKPWPLKATYQVIFCRNVMIYFDQPTQDGIWARFSERLAPGAALYIGHSERIATETLPFVLAGQTIYQRERAP
jgi:chemotaxis protein methyltransferase CheR